MTTKNSRWFACALSIGAFAAGPGRAQESSPKPAASVPFRYLLIADSDASYAAAAQIRRELLQSYPFNLLGNQIDIGVVKSDAATLKCTGGDEGIERVVGCDDANVAKLQAMWSVHGVAVVTDQASGGGGGRGYSVVGVKKQADGNYYGDYDPTKLLMHELGHSLGGLGDEYTYSAAEEKIFCGPSRPQWKNTACFAPKPSYVSDAEAKQVHQPDIPWSGLIAGDTTITTALRLGTQPGRYPSYEAALYRGGSCDSKALPCWKPYLGGTSIMDRLGGQYGYVHAMAIIQGMAALRGQAFDFGTAKAGAPANASAPSNPAHE